MWQWEMYFTSLIHHSLAFGQPTYLSSVLTPHQPQRSLRSVKQNLLSVPHCNRSFGQRSFSHSAHKIWNDIPLTTWRLPPAPLIRHSRHSALYKLLWMHEWMNKWSPVSCRSSAGQGKFTGQRPTFYWCATQPTNTMSVRGTSLCHLRNCPRKVIPRR